MSLPLWQAPGMTDPAILAELTTLRAELEQLRAQLATARLAEAPTMRARTRCPACHGTRIAHARNVLDRSDADARKELALCQPSWWSSKVVGELEAYACAACGLVEWYVKEPATLREVDDMLVFLEGSSPTGGPFR